MLINNSVYFEILEDIKAQIQNAQYRAVLGINREQIILYWNIGKIIIANSEWGNRFIDNLARDIKLEFPNAKGYSVRNLKYMRKFAEFVMDDEGLSRKARKKTERRRMRQLSFFDVKCFYDENQKTSKG